MNRLPAKNLQNRRTLGIMSGTSLDGVDLSLVRFTRRFRIAEHHSSFSRFPPSLKTRLLALATSASLPKDKLLEVDSELGLFYLKSAQRFLLKLDRKISNVDLVGCHGQTVYHRSVGSESSRRRSLTLQIGSPDQLAQGLAVPVISDFRAADVAAGGRGAPLAPIAHHYFFNARGSHRLIVNIGGISNVTYLNGSGRLSDVVATDCGPGNMLIDQVCARLFDKPYDKNGRLASRGTADPGLFRTLQRMGFLRRRYPMALGREQFGTRVVDRIIDYADRTGMDTHSTLCTVTLFTEYCIARVAREMGRMDMILMCGGGAHNALLRSALQDSFRGIQVDTTAALRVHPDFVESASFALLANLAVERMPGNLPQVTGAARPVILGRMTLA